MNKKMTTVEQMRAAALRSTSLSAQVALKAADAIEEMGQAKQDKLTGVPGQVVGFDPDGNAAAQAASAGGATLKITFDSVFSGQAYTVVGGGESYEGLVPEKLVEHVTVRPEGLTAYTVSSTAAGTGEVYKVTRDIQYFGVYPVALHDIKIVPWADGADEQIAAILDAAKAGMIDLQTDCGWEVGDVRTIQISAFTGGPGPHPAQSINIAISSFADYNGCKCAMQFDFKDELVDPVRMNPTDTNAGGYGASEMYTATLPALVNALPEWLRTRLVEFSVLASAGSQSDTIETVTGNRLALRSEVEVFGIVDKSVPGEGSQIEYYKTAENRQKKRGSPNTYRDYALRSPGIGRNDSFCYALKNGSQGVYIASGYNGLAPFGCI